MKIIKALFGRSDVDTKKVKVGSTTNYQIVSKKDPRKGASVVEHKDGSLNVVDRSGTEHYDGYSSRSAIETIFAILGLD